MVNDHLHKVLALVVNGQRQEAPKVVAEFQDIVPAQTPKTIL
jgi:hypothetical protein